MTREEQISQAAEAYDTNERYQYIFTEGAEWADSHRWHKASDGLPKDRLFFACRDFPNIEVLEYSDKKNGYWNTKGSFFAEPEASQYFTHWMEIPELPKED